MIMRPESPTKLRMALYVATALSLMSLLIYSVYQLHKPQVTQTLGLETKQQRNVLNAVSLANANLSKKPLIGSAEQVSYSTPTVLINDLSANTLVDTEIDGAARSDANGNLIIDQALRDYFDYFLSASDEIGPELAIQAAIDLINQSLPSAAAEQARGIFQRYLKYLSEQYKVGDQLLVDEIKHEVDALLVLKQTSEKLLDIRQRLFNRSESQAFFGLEDANTEFTLKSLELFADDSLDIEQRRSELDRMQSELPELLQADIKTSTQQKNLQSEIQAKLNQRLDDAQLYDELQNLNLSVQHTQELVDHRQKQDYFEQQYQLYRAAKVRLGVKANDVNLIASFFSTPEAQTAARLRDISSE